MRLRNSHEGYGFVTKSLHWVTVALILAQFVVGYVMSGSDDSGGGRGRGRGRGGDSGRGRGRGGDEADFAGMELLPVHVTLGVLILVVAILRVFWRVSTPLPPWAESLSPAEKKVEGLTERVLMTLLFVVPATGLLMVLSGEDDWVGLHVASHIAFFVALVVHLAYVFGHRVRTGDSLLRRMT